MNALLRHGTEWLAGRLRPRWIRARLSRALADVETYRLPERRTRLPGRRPLVIAPHPDDESIGCGGTLAAWVADGVRPHVAVLTDGAAGDHGIRAMRPDDPDRAAAVTALATARRRELDAALAALGLAGNVTVLNGTDGALSADDGRVVAELAEVLSRVMPDTVLLPFLTERHADHVAATGLFLAALDRAGLTVETVAGYEVWAPLPMNTVVNISAHVETKRAAIACYRSQTASVDYADGALALNRYREVSCLGPGTHAEAFHCLTPARLRVLWRRVRL